MFPKKKPFLFVLTMIVVMGLFIGCSKSKDTSSAANTNTSGTNNSGSETNDNSEFGQVTAINGSTITLSVFPGGGMPGNRNGGGNRQDMQSGDKPDMQSGDRPDMQSSDKPDMQSSDKPNMQSIETEEKEITISDESIIKVQDGDSTKAGTLTDITVGSMLQISYTKDASGNDVLSSVLVSNMGQGANRNNNSSDGGSSSGSTESEG